MRTVFCHKIVLVLTVTVVNVSIYITFLVDIYRL